MGKMKELLIAMETNADDAAVKEYVAQRPEDAAEDLRRLLAEAQKKNNQLQQENEELQQENEELEDDLEQTKDLVEDYRQGLGED